MGTKYTPTQLSGFLVPYVWDTTLADDRNLGTDYDEASPQFGAVTWSGSGVPPIQLEASGTPASGVTEIQAQIVTGGAPDGAAGVAWSTDGSTWYGRDGSTLTTGYQRVRTEGRSPSLAIRASTGVAYLIWYEEVVAATTWGYRVAYRSSTGAWTLLSTVATAPIGSAVVTACDIAEAPDGSLLAFVAVPTRTGSRWQIDVYRSETGASWRLAGRRAGSTDDGEPPRAIRVAFDPATGAGLMLVTFEVAGPSYTTLQYSSSDGGSTWIPVEGSGMTQTVAHDLIFSGGLFLALVDNRGLSPDQWEVYRVGQPTQDIFSGDPSSLDGGSPLPTDEGGGCLVADERGAITAYVTDDTTESIAGFVSTDFGSTFTLPSFGSLPVDASGTSATVIGGTIAGMLHRGVGVLVGSAWDGSAVSGGMYEVRVGGGSNVTLSTDIDGWKYFYVPTDTLAAFGWSASDTGAPTVTLSSQTGQSIACGAGDTASRRYTDSAVASAFSGWFSACIRVTAGTATLNFRAPGAGVNVEITSTQIRCYDETGVGGAWTNHGATGSTDYVDVLAVVDQPNARATVWFRAVDYQAPGDERTFTELDTVTSLADPGDDTHHWISVGASSTALVLWAGVQHEDATYPRISAGQDTDDLAPLALSSSSPAYAGGGALLRALGGGGYPDGTTYTAAVTSLHARGNVDPRVEPSPRRGWRSTGSPGSPLSTSVRFRHTLDPDGGGSSAYSGSEVVAIWLDRLVGVPSIQIDDSGGVIATADLRQPIAFQRSGPTVRPTSAAGSSVQRPWVEPDELAGGYVDLGGGDVRKIRGNSAGALTDTGTPAEHRCTIWIEDIDGTEATSGSGYIWPPRALVLWYLRGSHAAITDYIDVRILSTAGIGPEGYRAIGVMAIGRVEFLGLGVDRGSTTAQDSGFDVQDMPDRSTSRVRRGPMRRTHEIAIMDTWRDVQTVRGSAVSPDYVVVSSDASAYPAAARHADPLTLQGLMREVDGVPVVWLPKVPLDAGAGTGIVVYWYQRGLGAIYGYAQAGRIEQLAVGAVQSTDGYRYSTLTITEEP